jgi:hypothetical protein
MKVFSRRKTDGGGRHRWWISAALLSALAAFVPAVPAQQVSVPRPGVAGQWVTIGTMTADFKADHDSIRVRGPYDGFRRIKLKVIGADLEIQRLVVTYENGRPDELEVREFIRQGGETRAIDLKGIGRRNINRIDIWHKTKGILKGKATVIVFGMK